MTTTLTVRLLDAVTTEIRALSRVAADQGVSWPTVAPLLTAAAGVLAAWPVRPCRELGIDEHPFRSVR
jgi:hypothetical protein